jgi:hypothetical protein
LLIRKILVVGRTACDEYPFNSSLQGGKYNYKIGHTVSLRLVDYYESSETGPFIKNFRRNAQISDDGVSKESRFIALGIPGVKSFYTDRSGNIHFR